MDSKKVLSQFIYIKSPIVYEPFKPSLGGKFGEYLNCEIFVFEQKAGEPRSQKRKPRAARVGLRFQTYVYSQL